MDIRAALRPVFSLSSHYIHSVQVTHTSVESSYSIFMVHHDHSFEHITIYLIFECIMPQYPLELEASGSSCSLTFGFPCPIILVRNTSNGKETEVAAVPATHPLTKFTTEPRGREEGILSHSKHGMYMRGQRVTGYQEHRNGHSQGGAAAL